MKQVQLKEAGVKTRWGMIFDMDRCVGCQTCTIACKQTNLTAPGVMWRKVLDFEVGEFPAVDRTFLLNGCHHCDEPPCVPVCPTGATFKRADGIVDINYDVCIGCSSCVVACPYQARTVDKGDLTYYGGTPMPVESTLKQTQRVGVAQKCSFCSSRVDEGLARGLKPGVDPDATPACANACISQAIVFGNLADPQDHAARLLASQGGRQMHQDLGTNSQIFYLGERRANEEQPGPVQNSWDYRAAMNFILGGMSSGLMLVVLAAQALFGMPRSTLAFGTLGAAGLMAIGLFFVFLKLGRKLRFWRVATRWQSSWMTRETYCVGLIFPAVAASLWWPSPPLHALLAAGAAAFLYCQARILNAARGIPAWRSPRIPSLLMLTGLLEGAGLFIAASVLGGQNTAALPSMGLAGCALAIGVGALWRVYLAEVRAATMNKLDGIATAVTVLGHALPALGFLTLALLPASGPAHGLAALAGVSAAVTGAVWKFQVIVRAAHFQGVRIPGTRATKHRASPAVSAPAA